MSKSNGMHHSAHEPLLSEEGCGMHFVRGFGVQAKKVRKRHVPGAVHGAATHKDAKAGRCAVEQLIMGGLKDTEIRQPECKRPHRLLFVYSAQEGHLGTRAEGAEGGPDSQRPGDPRKKPRDPEQHAGRCRLVVIH